MLIFLRKIDTFYLKALMFFNKINKLDIKLQNLVSTLANYVKKKTFYQYRIKIKEQVQEV